MPHKMLHRRYVGTRADLQDKAALIQTDDARGKDHILAQFDDTNLKEAFGWHPFVFGDFGIVASDFTSGEFTTARLERRKKEAAMRAVGA